MLYLDNASTTMVSDEVAKVITTSMILYGGNPSSVGNTEGQTANLMLKSAEDNIKQHLHITTGGLIFTGSGSEANNLAIKGFYNKYKKYNYNLIVLTSGIEHSSVENSFSAICKDSTDIELYNFATNYDGTVDINYLTNDYDIVSFLNENTEEYSNMIFVSMMMVNNELGTIQDTLKLGKLLSEYENVIYHVDATQALGKVDLKIDESNIDLLTISGHKIHTPKGIGCLYVRDFKNLVPLIDGGHQQHNLRAGTENIPYIMGLEKAIELKSNVNSNNIENINPIFEYTYLKLKQLMKNYEFITLNGNESSLITGIFSVTIDGYDGVQLVEDLNESGISISNGSACNYGDSKPSKVLLNIGLTNEKAYDTIRISLSGNEQDYEIDMFMYAIDKLIKEHFSDIEIKTEHVDDDYEEGSE